MKNRKLAPLLAVTISLELMVAPVAFAAETGTSNSAAKVINGTAEAVSTGLQVAGQIWSAANNVNQANSLNTQTAFDMQKLQEQQTPQPDKYFNPQKLSKIPGLGDYLALNNINPQMLDCKTLPTTLHDARPEVCRLGVTDDSGVPPQAQLTQMFTYYNQYFQISKMYKNFSAESNSEGQAFGVGCMKNAMQILNGFFKYRMDELDKLTTNLEAMNNQFREASRADLDAIEETVAVLDGGSDLADKVRSRNPDLFDFAKRFDNPACKSMQPGEKLNELGSSGGLNQIKKNLKEALTAKSGKFSGESYAQSHAAVVEDINGLANKVSKQFELNYSAIANNPSAYGGFLTNLKNLVSSPNNLNGALSPDLFSDVQTKFNESYLKLSESRSAVESELKAYNAGAAIGLLGNLNNSGFEAEVSSIENRIKNECLNSTVGDVDTLLTKIYDPTASGHANLNASNFLKDKLKQIVENNDTSIEKKLAELKSLESQTGARYYMKMENSYEVQELDANGKLTTRVVGASSNRTPSVYFSDIIRNCNAQFKANNLNNKLSGSEAIKKLRQLNQDYKKLASSQASEMKNELRKKLIECSSPEEANNSISGSCTPDRFNTSSAGFCANAALSCSKNMQACSAQADNYVKEVKAQKTARVNNYKNLVQKNKQDIVKIFDAALSQYMQQGEALRGLFGAGFSSPTGIKREVPEGERYLGEFVNATASSPDGRLLLEDPEKYVEMFKGNIALLKESVRKQQDQILGGESLSGNNQGLLAEHIKKTEKNYRDVYREAEQIGENCRQNHDNAVMAEKAARGKQMEEQNKRMSELGEKRQEWCDKFALANENPIAACSGSAKDTIEALKAVETPEAREAMAKFSTMCREYNNSNDSGSSSVSFEAACLNVGATIGTVTSKAKFTGDDAKQVVNACNDTLKLQSKCKTSITDGVKEESAECKEVESSKKVVVILYQNLAKGSVGGITQDIDAGAVCAAQDNSQPGGTISKAILNFGNVISAGSNTRASGQ
ncbi:MAG: hypothetical protein NDI69_16820 [Bacteriovoracaceae bacterium]|nr:hypothetical protein [Bacteriovoracaceae bacterium]